MVKALSVDLRRRVVNAIERALSCRKAAERFGVMTSPRVRSRFLCNRKRVPAGGVVSGAGGRSRATNVGGSCCSRAPPALDDVMGLVQSVN